ncbi:hypothetical protein QBC47DRAFT_12232 [Echria macrotheca]|uniref:AB hydrolase-1 domain-containing protein n=1 Tax=Echria macrotheca TaxID=438768 RepID=A0AAJ0FB24_9PEZI|nr:hypothetical protein QBC47DRAFT_12232 [Echria macrotheca]
MAGAFSSLPLPSSSANGFKYPHASDPRSSSTQSLVPSVGERNGRRTLLVVYIHGFMGNDSSFQSFPAHVHSFLKDALADSHVIHSKIYPRYKTYKAIDVARENFSTWLAPHESPSTDVVLIGHSMGGLLAAEVALIPSSNPTVGYPFRHRILGTVSLDAPLLGLHPGIVVSGIASLFRRPAAPAQSDEAKESLPGTTSPGSLSPDPSIYSELSPPSEASSLASTPFPPPPYSQPSTSDPYFNPPFFNDTSFIDRGFFRNVAHFAKKHREENLVEAAAAHIMSHLEFGGCLADFSGLKSRYNRLRQLEDEENFRVRFVNYYTASTGPPKRPKPSQTPSSSAHLKPTSSRQDVDGYSSDVDSRVSTPRISIEDADGGRQDFLQELDPIPEPDEFESPQKEAENVGGDGASTPTTAADQAPEKISERDSEIPPQTETPQDPSLPPIPDLPTPPVQPDLDQYTNKEARKQAEKEAKRAMKVYTQAVKNRDKAIKEREKLVEKLRRKSLKEAEKLAKNKQKQVASPSSQDDELIQKLDDALRVSEWEVEERARGQQEKGEKKKKERKFCMLPGKVNGVRDPTWVRVYMEGVDEVGAHCGLFFPGPHYEVLVGDVGSRIVEWVGEDASRRAIAELRE